MKRYTILVTSTIGWGHVNACCGALSPLLRRGTHRLVFVARESFRERLEELGFEVYVYATAKKQENSATSSRGFACELLTSKVVGNPEPWSNLRNTVAYLDGEARIGDLGEQDRGVRQAITLYRPDLIYYDANALLPAIYYSGIPWVRNICYAPQYFFPDSTDTVPPGASGYPSKGDRSKWAAFREARRGVFHSVAYNDAIQAWGYARFPEDARCPASQSLTVYSYPEEINYPAIQQSAWFNLETFYRAPGEVTPLERLIPQCFLQDSLDGRWSGKLVYVSMGSLVSVDLRLMERLVAVLSKTHHKYILSKGHVAEELSLGRNLWGERHLPQTSLLPHVQLVITHGGNNTVTECLAAGLPMIVLPNFTDQIDNGVRLAEMAVAITLQTYAFTEKQMIDAIESLLGDEPLRRRLATMSRRIQASDGHEILAHTLERIMMARSQERPFEQA